MAKNKKKIVLIVLAAVVGVSIASVGVVKAMNKDQNVGAFVNTVDIEKTEDFRSTMISDGTLKSKDQRNIVSNLPYTISEVLVKEGDKVSAGDILAKLDTKELEYKIKTAEISLEIEKEKLNSIITKSSTKVDTFQLEKNVENTKLSYENSKSKYESSLELYEAGAISKSQLDLDEISMITAENSYELAKKQLEDIHKNDDNSSEIEIQKKSVSVQEINLASQKEALENAIIKSPIDGTVVLSNAKIGITAASTTPMFIIDDTDNLEIEVNISEYEISDLRVGQNVKVTGEAFKDHEFEGVLSFIAPVATVMNTNNGTETNIKVKIDIANTENILKPGLSANVSINTAHKDEALTVPYEVLYQKRDGATVVFKVVEGKAKEIPVTTGIQGDLNVEVISPDINEGDKIILDPNENIKDGLDVVITNQGEKK